MFMRLGWMLPKTLDAQDVEISPVPPDLRGWRYKHSSDWLWSVSLLPERKRQFSQPPTAPIASGWSKSPGGTCTHWKAAPCHGARRKRSIALALFQLECRGQSCFESLSRRFCRCWIVSDLRAPLHARVI